MTDLTERWRVITEQSKEAFSSAKNMVDKWGTCTFSHDTEEGVDHRYELVLDLVQSALNLYHEISFLRGYIVGQLSAEPKGAKEEVPDENGSVIQSITPGTAPCGEIGKSLGMLAKDVSRLARKLGISPAGRVEWELSNGILASANTYTLAQWHRMRNYVVHKTGRPVVSFSIPSRLCPGAGTRNLRRMNRPAPIPNVKKKGQT